MERHMLGDSDSSSNSSTSIDLSSSSTDSSSSSSNSSIDDSVYDSDRRLNAIFEEELDLGFWPQPHQHQPELEAAAAQNALNPEQEEDAISNNILETSIPAPVALKPDQVPDDMICSICITLPIEPVLTPCEHIFCRGCIHKALDVASQCPIDRTHCTINQLQTLKGFARRIWTNIQVKCGNHDNGCAWTGSIGDYANHMKLCSRTHDKPCAIIAELKETKNRLKELHTENRRLEDENIDLNNDLYELTETNDALQQDNESLTNRLKFLKKGFESVESRNASLLERLEERNTLLTTALQKSQSKQVQVKNIFDGTSTIRDQPEVDNLPYDTFGNLHTSTFQGQQNNVDDMCHGTYNFKRENVSQLSQLISRHMMEKPHYIDSNRIFNCVRTCYMALQKSYHGNPRNYRVDIKVLLECCKAATWFTDRQQDNFKRWYQEQF